MSVVWLVSCVVCRVVCVVSCAVPCRAPCRVVSCCFVSCVGGSGSGRGSYGPMLEAAKLPAKATGEAVCRQPPIRTPRASD